MKSILGSILLFVPIMLYAASLKVYLKQNPIHLGEPAQLVIVASGDDIELPKLERIADYPIAGRSLAESVVERNGEMVVRKRLALTFYPDHNITIPPIVARIDGKRFESAPIKLGVIKKIKRDDYVSFELKANKSEAYVGEPIILDMLLKIRRGLNIINYDFIPPKFDGFWVKELAASNKHLEEHGEYLIKHIRFLLLPQKPGMLSVAPAIFKYAVAKRTTDLFGFSVTAPQWHSVVSNSLQIVAKPLPKDVDLVGDFRLQVHLDKKRIKPNEPLNLTVTIDGIGNIENFSGVQLEIPNATIYEDRPKKEMKLEQGALKARFTQHFSIIAERDFTIPAIDIDYFSLKKRRIERLHHDPITIEVIGGKEKDVQAVSVQRNSGEPPRSYDRAWGEDRFWVGFGAGVGVALLFWALVAVGKRVHRPKFGDKRALLARLLPYVGESKEAASMAQALYEEIYGKKRGTIKKKEVERLLEDLMQRRGPLHPGA